MSQEFINYLAELISEDIDLTSLGGLIYETDEDERRLERLALNGDDEAAERLKAMRLRINPLTLSEVFDQYCEIVGYRPEDINHFPDSENEEADLDDDARWDSMNDLALVQEAHADNARRYLDVMSKRRSQRSQMAEWLQDRYIRVKSIPGFVKLVESLWYSEEYLDGKVAYYTFSSQPEVIARYEQDNKVKLSKLENRIKRLLGETNALEQGVRTTPWYADHNLDPEDVNTQNF
jgi:hypothetical protein